jgi:Tol biopolymer transport system component
MEDKVRINPSLTIRRKPAENPQRAWGELGQLIILGFRYICPNSYHYPQSKGVDSMNHQEISPQGWSLPGNCLVLALFMAILVMAPPTVLVQIADCQTLGFNGQALRDIRTTGYITFTRKPKPALRDEDSTREIFLYNMNAGTLLQLTKNNFNENQAAVSPDGKQIVFESIREDLNGDGKINDDDRDIYVMNIDGTNQHQLLPNGKYKAHPEWSPDGKKIVFLMMKDKFYESDIFATNADGSAMVQLTTSGDTVDPTWSPDGSKIVYVRFKRQLFVDITHLETELWVMDNTGNNKKLLINSEFDGAKDNFKHSIFDPAFSPDGQWIAFNRRVNNKGNFGLGSWHVYIMRPDGTQVKDLNKDQAIYGYPQWTGNPAWLMTWGFSEAAKTIPHLMLINKDTGEIRNLTDSPDCHDEMPFWR